MAWVIVFWWRRSAPLDRDNVPVPLSPRVWERGNGETLAAGTSACAAVVAAVLNGYCNKDQYVMVKLQGGDLMVKYTDETVFMTGKPDIIFRGVVEV